MTTNAAHTVSSRRTILAGALGVGALGGVAASSDTAIAALGDPAIPSDPDVSFFLKVDGVPGSSVVKGFEGQIELLTWAWGVDSSSSSGSGGGGGAGKATARDLVALGESGIQSPLLMLGTATGKHVPSVLLTCARKPKKPVTFMTIRLEDVLVTSYAVTPDPTAGVPLDLIHLSFDRITQTVIPQNADGSAGTPVTASFDFKTQSTA